MPDPGRTRRPRRARTGLPRLAADQRAIIVLHHYLGLPSPRRPTCSASPWDGAVTTPPGDGAMRAALDADARAIARKGGVG